MGLGQSQQRLISPTDAETMLGADIRQIKHFYGGRVRMDLTRVGGNVERAGERVLRGRHTDGTLSVLHEGAGEGNGALGGSD
jgi:hypothetical protein